MNTNAYSGADVFGVSHVGQVRTENEDRFAVAALRKTLTLMHSNVDGGEQIERDAAFEALLMLVADGVGGNEGGEEASHEAAATIMTYLTSASSCFNSMDADSEHQFLEQLEAAVHRAHERVTQAAADRRRPPATTLTMALLVASRAYVVHVGDSRAMYLRNGRLRQLTRDQTMAEELLDMGAITEEQAARSTFTHQLTSAVGGSHMSPSLGLVDLKPNDMFLLCSDGLTKHVTDERIAAVLGQPWTAEQMGVQLRDEALAGGGTDNIALVVARILG